MESQSIAKKAENGLLTLLFALRVILMILTLALIVIPHLLFRLFNRPSPMVMVFLNVVGWIAGLRIRTTGKRPRRNTLFISNHLSWMDIIALGGAARSAFVSKAEIASAPLVGWLADQNNTVYVERDTRADIGEQTRNLRDALASGQPVTLFPEGTTGPGDELLPFRSALFQALVPADDRLELRPVFLDYGPDATDISWKRAERGVANFRRILSRWKPIHLTIHYLDPLPIEDGMNRKQLAEAARVRIADAMADAMAGVSRPSATAADRL